MVWSGSREVDNGQQFHQRILTYGTFDLLHHGHLRLFQRLRGPGDWLGVGLSTEEFNFRKGKEARQSYATRLAQLRSSGFVDYVFPEVDWEQKIHDIVRLRITTFAMGDDWKGHFDHLSATGVRILYLPRTPGVDSTRLREGLLDS